MSKRLFTRLRDAAVQLGDPQREERLRELALQVERDLLRFRREFKVIESLDRVGARDWERPLIIERVYELGLRRAWSDLRIGSKEQLALDWVATALALSADAKAKVEWRVALAVFESYLLKTFEDGVIDEQEAASLESIATALDTTTATLVRQYFREHGDAFLRSAFSSLACTGNFRTETWNRFLKSARRIGAEDGELQWLLGARAQQYLEWVLACAKADDRLSDDERLIVNWLLETLPLPNSFLPYVREELRELEVLTQISSGSLPSVGSHIEMRAGEICHYQGSCVFQRVRYVQSGPRLDEYHGAAAITDTRFAFTAAEKAWAIPHRRVLQLNDIHHGVHLQTGKGSGSYYFGPDHKTATLIYRTAVAKANRKIVGDPGGLPSRHIPGDVRDRVWQEYSGRCAECKADQYLEFDHIIPVAKGGNNTQANIQLLCRRCNLTKSDSI